MGFGPFSSESNATQTAVTVSDQGQYNNHSPVLQGSAKGTIGKGSQYAESGAVQIGSRAKLNTALFAGANLRGYKGDITITDDGGAAENVLGQVLDLWRSQPTQTANSAPSTITVLPAPVATDSSGVATNQSASSTDKLKKIAPLIIGALVLAWFLFFRKRK